MNILHNYLPLIVTSYDYEFSGKTTSLVIPGLSTPIQLVSFSGGSLGNARLGKQHDFAIFPRVHCSSYLVNHGRLVILLTNKNEVTIDTYPQ